VNLIVIAKAPAPGRSKTRLCPPCSPEQAAHLAEAALADTLRAVAATPAARRVVVLDGEPGAWLPRDCEVVAQRGGGLDERLANAFEDVGGPALLIGMDTPQVTPVLLRDAVRRLGEADAVLGPALDGGFWALGLTRPDRSLLVGVPMSVADTGRRQHACLRAAGLSVTMLPALRDVDRMADARAVAAEAPRLRFAHTLARVERRGRFAQAVRW
jgi:uncharacterized protein